MDLKEEALLGDSINEHWYYQSKARVLASYIKDHPQEVLDVGAGDGWFSRWLLRSQIVSRAVCVDPGYDHNKQEEEAGRSIQFVKEISKSEAEIVLMMDVLEHVDNDVALLSQYLDAVNPGTPVFITVPAFQFLWSAHDEFLEHRRRYTVASLRQTVESTGASILSIHYYFGAILPIVIAARLFRSNRSAEQSDMMPQPRWINYILRLICTLERPLMKLNRLGGVTVVCLCHKV